MAIKKFNSIDGFSVGSDTPIAVIDNVANVTANSLLVSNKSNLGNVGNITITGGSAGYVLKTDGAGNLSWGIDTAAAGGSNRDIQFNDGGSLNGTSNFTYNSTTSVLTLTGNLITTNATLGNVAGANYFVGNGSLLTYITGSNVSGYVQNANLANIATVAETVTTAAQPNITSVGTLNSLSVTANITAGNITDVNLVSANYIVGNGSLLTYITGSNVYGNVTFAVTSNWSNTANSVAGANVTGYVANATYANTANIAATVTTAAQPNITSVGTLSNLTVADTVNANYFTGIITTTHQPNIESLGNLVGLTVSNVYGLVDFNTTANVSLGDISNLHILGGTPGYVLTTDGYGDLSWEAAGSSGTGFVSIRKDNFTGNGVQTQFPLSAIPSGEDAVEVNLNGLIQQGYVYNVVGSNVVFTTAPVSGANIEITTFGALAINQTDSQILFIDGSNLTGSNNFTFTESNNTLSVDNVSTTANVTAGNIKTNNLLYSNGSPYVFTTSASGSNTQVQYNDSNSFAGSAAFTFDNGTNTLSVTNIVANGSGITYITGSNISGNVDFAITSNWANTANSVSGTNVTGNVNSAVQAHYANIANSVAGTNVTGQVGNALIASTVYTAAQPNITSVGTLTSLVVSGDATITGNLIVSGNTEYTNVNNLYIKDPIIEMGGGANGAVLSSNDGKDRGSLLHYYTTAPVDAFMGWDNSNAEFAFGSNVSVSSEVVTFNSFGNVRANYFIGDGSLLTNINAGNITGAYSNTNVAAYLPTYTGNVSANYFIGNGATLTNIIGANVTGYVPNATNANIATIAGTVTTASQPNITSVGNLTTLTVTGNVSASYFIGNGSQLTGLPAQYANSNVANYLPTYTGNVSANYFIGNGATLTNITGANITGYVQNANLANTATVADTVTTNAQPNITSVGTLTSLTVTGTITAGNANIGSGTGGSLTGANLISANYFVGDGSLLTNINAGNITGAYSNTNVAAYLPTYNGNVSANYFIGNGSTLTNVTGANVIGNVTYAVTSNWSNVANSVLGINVSGNVDFAITSNWANTANSVSGTNVSGNVTSAIQSHYANIANSVAGANVSGQVGNALVAGTVYTANQPNITSVGTLLGVSITGNLDITGNINATGNLNYSNVNDLVVGDPLIYLGANNTGNLYDLGIVASYNDGTYYHTGIARDATDGTWKLFDQVVAEPTTVIDFANGTYAPFKTGSFTSTGNITATNANLGNVVVANYFIGDGSLLTGLPAQYANSNVANYLPTYTGNVSANYFIGDGSLLTNINAANITGSYSNANVENYLPTYTGNISANYFIGNGATLTYITGSNVSGNVDFAITSNWSNTANAISGANVSGNVDSSIQSNYANTANSVAGSNVSGNVADAIHAYYADVANSVAGANVSGNVEFAITSNWANVANSVAGADVSGQVSNALVAGTVYTNSQPNITSIGTLINLDVTGNISAGNANLGNVVVANYFIGDGSLLTGLPAQYANSNVANYLPIYTGNISANYFIGNGSTITYITGSNVSGNVDFAITSNWANTANSVAGANVSGTVANATYATSAGTADSAITAGTVTTASQPNITSFGTLTELTVDGLTDLGPIGNVTITGGTSGYVLTTNGAGDLSWQAAGGSTGPGFVNITKNSFTGNGVQTIFTLTTTPASEASLLVNIDGITQQDAAYSLSGSNVTFASAPLNGEIVEIVSYGSIGIGSNTTVLFNDAGDIGNTSTFAFNKYSNTLSVTNIDTTSITFDTGVITVAGANAGIFTSGVDNINLGLGANITVGSSSGNTTIQGNLIAGNISTTSNLAISGTATISNLKVNDLYSNRTPVSVSTNTIVDSFSVNKYRSAKYTMRVNSDDGYQAVEVLLIHDGSNSYVTIYGSLSTIGTDIVTLSSNILSGNVRLLATTGSANTTVNLLGTYVAD